MAYINFMKQTVPLILALSLVSFPVMAQDDVAPDADIDQGFNLMQEGAQLLFRGLMDQMEPTLDDLGKQADELAQGMEPALRMLTDEMGPALMALLARIDDIKNYEAPEFLDNGDIIIRRSPDAPPYAAPEEEPPGEIEL